MTLRRLCLLPACFGVVVGVGFGFWCPYTYSVLVTLRSLVQPKANYEPDIVG